MSLSVHWPTAAEESLKRIPSTAAAARISKAVLAYATSGIGDVRRASGGEYRLHVPPYVVRFSIDATTETLVVWSVYSRGA